MSAPVCYPLIVYYDASCPLCATEMRVLKETDALNRIQLVDCSIGLDENDPAVRAGIAREDLMQAIHAQDGTGSWLRGVDVFAAVYAAVGLRGWASLWSNRWLRPLWTALYPWVARNRQRLSILGVPRLWALLISARRKRG